MLEGLDSIPWRKLSHAYGSAHDVPDLLRALTSADDAERVYAASNASVYAVDATTGQATWSGGPGGWLSIARGGLYVAQANGTLSAYALSH